MKGFLINQATGEQYELENVSFLGRSPECNVLIPDPRVSRRHAMIRRHEEGFWFFDLGSFNGTYLNGSRITAARLLEDGDQLEFADLTLQFKQEGGQFTEADPNSVGASTMALIRSAPVIMLVSDVRGFTTLSEKLPPDRVAHAIGNWYANCEVTLGQYGATVDKFGGDSVLAYWTDVAPANRLNALRAAKGLMKACDTIYHEQQELFDSLGLSFSAGAALHLGKVAYGGMSQREFTLIGDPVNLTYRIEALTRTLEKPILASIEFLRDWPEGKAYCEPLGMQQVKGRAQPVEVYSVERFPE